MSRWEPLTQEEANLRKRQSKARYRASARSKEKEKETRKKYAATESGRRIILATKKRAYEKKMASMTDAERKEWNARHRQTQAALRKSVGEDVWRARVRRVYLKSTYNLSVDEYERMRINGCMALSLNAPGECRGPLAVDHDHSCCSGRRSCGACVRYLLCSLHNARLGGYEKHREWAELYLEMDKIRKEKAS